MTGKTELLLSVFMHSIHKYSQAKFSFRHRHTKTPAPENVAACYGQYADALSKGVGVSLLVAETTGALAASFMTILRLLARQTRLPGATDNTRYGEGRASPRSFLTHHVANISTAIQAADAQTILNAASARMLRVSYGVM